MMYAYFLGTYGVYKKYTCIITYISIYVCVLYIYIQIIYIY